jgi:peroxiredoxin
MSFDYTETEALVQMVANTGDNLYDLSNRQPVMLVFLRHFGCTFCREALADIAHKRASIENTGTRIVFVHMAEHELAERYFDRYGLEGVMHISDPACRFYAAFGLVKGSLTQLFGLHSFIRGFQSSIVEGHGLGPMLGDGFQMPGVFVLHEGAVRESFIHKLASDRPDYVNLAKCCLLET